MTRASKGTPVDYDIDQLIFHAGERMLTIIGAMQQLGLTGLAHFVREYLDPSLNPTPEGRDFDRWLKWALSPKNSADREHLWPRDLAEACQMALAKNRRR